MKVVDNGTKQEQFLRKLKKWNDHFVVVGKAKVVKVGHVIRNNLTFPVYGII